MLKFTLKKNRSKNKKSAEKLKPLQRLSLFFFTRPRKTALLWLIIAIFGAASYATLLKREGFPSIDTPFAVANGTYLVDNSAKVDREVAGPLSKLLLEQDGVKSVQTQSMGNFYSVITSYEQDVSAVDKTNELKDLIAERNILPEQATFQFEPFKLGFTERGDDMVVSFYAENEVTAQQLTKKAQAAANFLQDKNLPLVENVSIINPFQVATNPVTGEQQTTQQSFDRYGERAGDQNSFYNSVVVGIDARDNADKLELDDQVQKAISELNAQPEFSDFQAVVSASSAPDIKAQISELQRVLLEGLIAILVVGSIVIAIRASILTVATLITVLAVVNGFLYLIGYSLNTITLFALILGLALIIDDTIIMVEALDAQRRRQKKASEAVKVATGKISRAMVAATLTASLSFAPLIFVSGILGEFIRAIPITIISALVISLFVALIFIPLFARFLLLGKNQLGEKNVHELAAGFEERIAEFLARPMLWARNSKKRLFSVGITAVMISFLFIGAGGYLFQKVTFNIFPSSKDANYLSITLNLPPNTDIKEAQNIVDEADKLIAESVGESFDHASYYGQANTRTAILSIALTDYKDRDIRAPELVDQLEEKFKSFEDVRANVTQIDAGPPPSAFAARVDSNENREAAIKLSQDIAAFLSTAELKRIDGSVAKIKSVSTSNADVYTRADSEQYVEATATFEDTDTTTLVTLAQDAVENEFTAEKIKSYGLSEGALDFNFGQEDDNQESFQTLAYAFPAVLAAIYILLAFQFRSLLQPLLIFMAIPFSLFGISLGLYLTDNAFSFFAMLGFFALIGLSIKNTILLTDYANQSRRAGADAIDSAHAALAERFRPLVATSLTAIFSLIPLALTSPFWEGLTVVLIFGLVSSTFLVLTVFPYYYLAGEYLRSRFSRKIVISWMILSIVSVILLSLIGLNQLAALAPVAVAIGLFVYRRTQLAKI